MPLEVNQNDQASTQTTSVENTPKESTQNPQTNPKDTTKTDTQDDRHVGGIKYYREQLERERAEREKLAAEVESIRTNKLKEQNQWKDLYEQEQKKAEEYQNKLKTVSSALVEDKMRMAIEKEVLAAGILPSAVEDLDLVDKSMIEVETTSSGRINFHNVKEFVDSLKLKKPHWFGAHQDPNINNRRSDYTKPTELTADQILELQTKDPKRYNEIMQQKIGRR